MEKKRINSTSNKFKYKYELAQEMGISMRTFQRKLNAQKLVLPRGLISPEVQEKVLEALMWREMA